MRKQLKSAKKNNDQQQRYLILEAKILGYQGKFEQAHKKVTSLLKKELSTKNKSTVYYLQARMFQRLKNLTGHSNSSIWWFKSRKVKSL